jgi:FMN-dependent NADH-azoreductase
MSKVLHIEASPRAQASHSSRVARVLLDAYKYRNPGAKIETANVWEMNLPKFDQDMVDAKMALLGGVKHTPAQAAAWKTVTGVFNRIAAADRYVISTPMWNFGLPYPLKQLIDIIAQPGLAFGFDPAKGLFGLLTGRKAVTVYSSSIDYAPGTAYAASDHQSPHLATLLGLFGIEHVGSVSVAPTLGEPAAVAAMIEQSEKRTFELAKAL